MRSSSMLILFFLMTPCFSIELFDKVCAQSYDICLKNCDRQYNLCKVGSIDGASNKYCENQFAAGGNPCLKKCDAFKEDCANKTK